MNNEYTLAVFVVAGALGVWRPQLGFAAMAAFGAILLLVRVL